MIRMALRHLHLRLLAGGCGLALIMAGCPQMPDRAAGQDDEQRSSQVDFLISPSMGPIEGGTIVTIVGRGFREGTSVQFGANTASDVTIVNEQLITAVSPSGDAVGVVDVTLRIPVEGREPLELRPLGLDLHVLAPPELGSSTTSVATILVLTEEYAYYILPPDDGTDTDGDGLTDYAELAGWEVWTDAFGLTLGQDTFGNVTRYTCISDPAKVDTDGDGLRDDQEFFARCDARKADTDGDDLTDFEEVIRFHTSPISIDSDHDARGPTGANPPNVNLFDGAELVTAGFETPDQLFFSEYLEGVYADRALEIYNPTESPIDLAADGYALTIRNGGDGSFITTTLPLSGTIARRSTHVVANLLASAAIRARADQLATLPFDGGQIIELRRGAILVDAIGSETTVVGPAVIDQQQTQGALWRTLTAGAAAEQSFTVGATGRLDIVDLKVRNPNGLDSLVTIYRGNTVIASGALLVPPSSSDGVVVTVSLNGAAGAGAPVFSGEMLTLHVGNTTSDNFDLAYADGNPYANGQAVDIPGADYYFVTTVAPYLPWGDADHSTRDHVLRRKYGICAPDASAADAFDPAIGWDVYPLHDIGGLGSHEAYCVPMRIVVGGTSPSLADTDGDNLSDWEEFDHPLRSPLVADLPVVAIDVADPIDVRLFVEYADSVGDSTEYSTSFLEGTSTTTGSAHSSSISDSIALGLELEAEYGSDASHFRIQGSFEYGHEWGQEWSTSTESTTESQSEYARIEATSRERQESVARGEISTGLIIRNTGPVAYDLSDMGIAVRQYVPDLVNQTSAGPRRSQRRTIATLLPAINSVTLASGEKSPVIQFADDEVNPVFVREFLANPTGLILEPAAFALTNEQGLNYAFITQTTQSRTALVSIDYTDSEQAYESYYVATNVDRHADGSFAGIPLRTVLEQIVGLPRKELGDADLDAGYVVERLDGTGPFVLTRIRGLGPDTVAGAHWFVIGDAQGLFEDVDQDGQNDVDFDDIVLHAGDAIRLVLARDGDADGLLNLEEAYHGTSDAPGEVDTDGDGLTDKAELNGWPIIVAGVSRWVVSNPLVSDSDQDGLSDAQEFAAGIDPRRADTDGDSLGDGVDPFPQIPAVRLHVNAAASPGGNGFSWASAFPSLGQALFWVQALNTNGNPTDDVSEVWVARGTYLHPVTMTLFPVVGVYGGFAGTETERAQRNPDPFTNETIISGNIGDPSSATDNVRRILQVGHIGGDGDASVTLDGFTITDAYCTAPDDWGAVVVTNKATLQNLLVTNNVNISDGVYAGGGIFIDNGANPTLTNVSVIANSAVKYGGGVYALGSATLQDCQIIANLTTYDVDALTGGAGMYVATTGSVRLTDCLFESNLTRPSQSGGGISIATGGKVVADRCRFRQNNTQPLVGLPSVGGGIFSFGSLIARNCTFWGNNGLHGAAVLCNEPAYFFNCSFGGNNTITYPLVPHAAVVVADGSILQNCVLAGNATYQDGQPSMFLEAQLHFTDTVMPTVRNCLLPQPVALDAAEPWLIGNGNVFVPSTYQVFVNGSSLRVPSDSPTIDAGLAFFDADPLTPGIQFLDDLDASGNPRTVDGDGDGEAVIDMGAHEIQ